MILASAYFGSILMVGAADNYGFGVLNPAIGTMTSLVMTFEKNKYGIKWFWIYLIFPVVGAILAVIFHEVFYKKMQDSIVEHEEKDEGLLDKNEVLEEDDSGNL
jgi:glycerol uptake facilitator-like aquaporin